MRGVKGFHIRTYSSEDRLPGVDPVGERESLRRPRADLLRDLDRLELGDRFRFN